MRFLRQISEGEVLIKDNEVLPQTAAADAQAEAWVKEYTGPSIQVPQPQQACNMCIDLSVGIVTSL